MKLETNAALTSILGNTDTVHYWNLSRNIFRFSPRRAGTTHGVHTVDERIDVTTHLEGMRLYYELIRNFDAYDGEQCNGRCPTLA